MALANVERRHEGNDAAVRILEEHIAQSNNQVGGILAAEQVRILWQCKGAVDEARQIFVDKQDRFPDSRDFWLKYLQFEVAQPSADQEEAHKRVKAVYELMRSKGNFPTEVSKELSQHYMDYLMNRGGKDAAEEYMQLDRDINGYVSSAKSAPSHSQKRKGQPHNTANKRQRK
jgi:pre-mRNA-processing factor 39